MTDIVPDLQWLGRKRRGPGTPPSKNFAIGRLSLCGVSQSRRPLNGLDIVVLADALRSLLAEARADALNISEDKGLASAPSNKRI
jgi:hypothetical protein